MLQYSRIIRSYPPYITGFLPDKDISIDTPIQNGSRKNGCFAAMIEYLCHEQGLEVPNWVLSVPACQHPWFVAGIENLKAIALVESPLEFRIRKIFVLENFLDRV
jgi:hypothetical protein